MQYNKGGREYTFNMDLDYIVGLESQDPDFSISDVFATFEKGKVRFTELNILTQFIGAGTYQQFVESGLSLDDLVEIVNRCFVELGFIEKTPSPE